MSDTIKYHNVLLTNNGQRPIPASITDRRNAAILVTPQNWECSVVRFQISSDAIPLFRPVIPDPLFPLRTNMSVSLRSGPTVFQTFVSVTPDEVANGVFGYNNFLQNVNAAMRICYALLQAVYPGTPSINAPVFFLDPPTGLISMYTDVGWLAGTAGAFEIGVNQPLQQLLDLPFDAQYPQPAPLGFDYWLSVNDSATTLPPIGLRINSPYAVDLLVGPILRSSQEFRTIQQWSSVRSILFQTNLIPVVQEMVPNIVGQEQNFVVNSSSVSIMTDFEPNKDPAFPTRGVFQYVPSAEYRMIQLTNKQNISAIDVTAFYQTYDGQIHPIMLPAGTNMSVKIMFRRIAAEE